MEPQSNKTDQLLTQLDSESESMKQLLRKTWLNEIVQELRAGNEKDDPNAFSWEQCCAMLGIEIAKAAKTALPPSTKGLSHEDWSSKWVEASTESMDAFDELTGPLLSCFIWQAGVNSVRRSLAQLSAAGESSAES